MLVIEMSSFLVRGRALQSLPNHAEYADDFPATLKLFILHANALEAASLQILWHPTYLFGASHTWQHRLKCRPSCSAEGTGTLE